MTTDNTINHSMPDKKKKNTSKAGLKVKEASKRSLSRTPDKNNDNNTADNYKPDDIHDNIILQKKLAGDENSLTTNDKFRLLDLYFCKEFYTYRHLHDSFDKFIDDTIPNFFREAQHVFSEFITEERYIKHKFVFSNKNFLNFVCHADLLSVPFDIIPLSDTVPHLPPSFKL